MLSPDGSTLFIGSFEHNVYALYTNSGSQKWMFQGDDSSERGVLSPDGSVLYISAGNLSALYTNGPAVSNSTSSFYPEIQTQTSNARPSKGIDGHSVYGASLQRFQADLMELWYWFRKLFL